MDAENRRLVQGQELGDASLCGIFRAHEHYSGFAGNGVQDLMRGVANVPGEIAIHEVAELPKRRVRAAGLPATPAEKFNHAAHVDAGDVAPHVVVSACRRVKAKRCVCVFVLALFYFWSIFVFVVLRLARFYA